MGSQRTMRADGRPSFEVGGRIQLDAHYGPLGYFVAFDWYPGMEAGPRRFEVAMMAQLSV
jgi:hypothetical protein